MITTGRYVMKFVMIVLAIHFIGEMIGNKRKKVTERNTDEKNIRILHPAEFPVR
jgi:hypothetical protein